MVIFIFKNSEVVYDYGKFTLDKFEFENGIVIENPEVEFRTKGVPKYDESGNITNAILICHKYDGNCSSIDELYSITCEGAAFDYNKYFLISISSLGTPDSCSPSTTGLRYKFPEYTFSDKVNFKKQFLKEKFNIEKVLGLIGTGMGGYEVYTWACEYTDFMDFIVIVNSSFKTNGYRYAVSKAIESIIESSDDFYSDIYNDSLSRMMLSINKILYTNYPSRKNFQKMTNDEIDILMEDHAEDQLFVDIYDFKLQNYAIMNFNLENKISNIKAKTLVIIPVDEMYFSKEYDILPLEDLIENCEIIPLELNFNHFEFDVDYSELNKIFNDFLEEFD